MELTAEVLLPIFLMLIGIVAVFFALLSSLIVAVLLYVVFELRKLQPEFNPEYDLPIILLTTRCPSRRG